MKMLALLSKNSETLPGRTGIARVDRDTRRLLARVGPGDIAVLDEIDLDRLTAERLVEAEVAAVVNASPSISGRFPNLGPEILVANDIPLLDTVTSDAFGKIKDGSRVRIDGGVIYSDRFGRKEAEVLVECLELDEAVVAERMIDARNGLADHLESFAGNTIEFIRTESALLIDGIGVPEPELDLRGRQVIVVGDEPEHQADLKRLKPFIKEYSPVMIGVGRGADTILHAKHSLDVIIGDPEQITTRALRSGAEIFLPADIDGRARGLERIRELGLGATTFPCSGTPADLALLLAHHNGAALIVTAGAAASLDEFLDRSRRESNPATFLTRMTVGNRLMDATAVATLYRSRVSGVVVALLVLTALIAAIVAVLLASDATAMLASAQETWERLRLWVDEFGQRTGR